MEDHDSQRLLGELYANSIQTKEKLEAMEHKITTVESKISALHNELSIYKTVVKTIRAILLTVVAIVGFKFGDISSTWSNIFNGK